MENQKLHLFKNEKTCNVKIFLEIIETNSSWICKASVPTFGEENLKDEKKRIECGEVVFCD